MTDPYERDPSTRFSIELGSDDETLFEDSFDALYKADLRKASRNDLILVLGMAVGTVMRLRARIKELEKDND
jgi:hypothetical protein